MGLVLPALIFLPIAKSVPIQPVLPVCQASIQVDQLLVFLAVLDVKYVLIQLNALNVLTNIGLMAPLHALNALQ